MPHKCVGCDQSENKNQQMHIMNYVKLQGKNHNILYVLTTMQHNQFSIPCDKFSGTFQ